MNKNATEIWNETVADVQRKRNCSFDEAYRLARVVHKVLFNEMQADCVERGKTRLANEEANKASGRTQLANNEAMAARGRKVQTLVNDLTATGMSYDDAYRAVRLQNAGLFGEMIEPS